MCGLFLFGNRCGSATEATATTAAAKAAVATAATVAATIATAVTTTTAATPAAVAAGQAVDAGAGRVRLATGAHRLAVGQIQTRKLCGFQGVDVAWQLVAIAALAIVLALTASMTAATVRATALRAGTTRCGTPLAITAVVKTGIAALFLTATTFATTVSCAFSAPIALAFKARCTLWALWPISA